ncbi:MAG: T9SS type A sorting domain-containing protein, partial [Saprospiraceae bacterium]|nr:T9SS type A sorting domain-containing protein [Saprospiraceae bacterium]
MRSLILLFLLSVLQSSAQNPLSDSCKINIGTNLAGPADYGSEWPFVNVMKYSREWTPHNNQWVDGGQNPWDSGLMNQIPLDADGYPLALPVTIPGAEAPQVVRTVWANTESMPEGVYVVLYDGVGDLDVWGDATLLSETPGRLEFQLTFSGDIFALEIYQSQAGNHVRNIRVLLPGTENTYAEQPYDANWLDKLAPFSTLRFMDWGYTNNSPMRNWDQRTLPTDYTWTRASGVPYEMWVDICNRTDADAWVCVPHAASDDYIIQLATMFRDELEPDRKIYVEWSNEVWNWSFEQAHYGLDSMTQSLSWPERLAPRIGHVMQLWANVFAGQENRLVRVQGGQHGWWDIGERIFAQLQADGQDHLIDAISPAAYMGLNNQVLATWDGTTTGQDVLDLAGEFTFDPAEWAMTGWLRHAALARNNNKKLVFYEGGQHFTPDPFGTVQPYCQALIDCQTMPGMYDLYQRLFDTLRTLSGDEMLFMNFSFISPLGCQYGSWGALQSQFLDNAPFDNAPKYRALLDAIDLYNSCATSVSASEPSWKNLRMYPNPTDGLVWLEGVEKSVLVRVFSADGKLVSEQNLQGNTLNFSGFQTGVYLVQVVDADGVWSG